MSLPVSSEHEPFTEVEDQRVPVREPLVPIALAIAVGMAVDVWWEPPWAFSAIVVGCGLIGWRVCHRCGAPRSAVAGLLIAAAGMGCMRAGTYVRSFPGDAVHLLADKDARPVVADVRCVGNLQYFPAPAELGTRRAGIGGTFRYLAQVERIRPGNSWRTVTGRVVITVRQVSDADATRRVLRPGQCLRVWGTLQQIPPTRNPGGFSSRDYWRLRRVRAQVLVDSPEFLARRRSALSLRPSHWLWHPVTELRDAIRARIQRMAAPRHRGLALALLLGDRSLLDSDQMRVFRETGTAHLLAVSGMHVALALGWFWWIDRMGWLPRSWSPWAIMLAAISYALVTGGQPPVWRAALLVTSMSTARYLGRETSSRQQLAAVALVMWWLRPTSWLDSGVQLSFLAVAALCWYSQVGHRREPPTALARLLAQSRPLPWRLACRVATGAANVIKASLAVVVMTTPLVWYAFGAVTWTGIVLSPIMAVITAFCLWIGWAAIACSVLPWSAPAACGGVLLSWLLELLQNCADFGASAVPPLPLPRPPSELVLTVYATFVAGWLWRDRRWHLRWGMATVCIAVLPMLVVGNARRAGLPLQCTFFSVGHGTCAVIQTPDGQNWLYDAGTMGDPSVVAREVARAWRHCGINRLDQVIVSHCDSDHFNLLPYLAEEFPIGLVWLSHDTLVRGDAAFVGCLDGLARRRIPWRLVGRGDAFVGEGYCISVIHPPVSGGGLSDNESSVVLVVRVGDGRLLLPGDLEGKGLELAWPAINNMPRHLDVLLMAPHHGSRHSEPARWRARFPAAAVVISGARNSASATQARWSADAGGPVFHSSRGAVRCDWTGGRWRCAQWQGRAWEEVSTPVAAPPF